MDRDVKILVVAPEYPYPPIDGYKVRIFNLLKHLTSNIKFDFIAFGSYETTSIQSAVLRNHFRPSCESIEIVPYSTLKPFAFRNPISRIQNIIFPRKNSILPSLYSKDMAERINERIASVRYELIFLCGMGMSLYFDNRVATIPTVVDVCDCPSLLKKSYMEREKRFLKKFKKWLDYIWSNRYEKLFVSKIRNIIMISSVDAKMIQMNCQNSNIWVVPNGVDIEYFINRNDKIKTSGNLLFTGVMDYQPNNDAMLYFIKQIYPIIKKVRPETTLTIAGRNPTSDLKSIAEKTAGVKVTGFVDDLRPYFESATVYVSPLSIGAGMKNKILEAWSMKIPIIASSVSCSGILTRDRENILIADNPDDFAKKVLDVFDNEVLRNKLSSAGRETVERKYSWSEQGKLVSSICLEIIADERLI
jgi:polysaccharide biosynthesis protein PslH